MDKRTAINGGKELAKLLMEYCAKNASGNSDAQDYINRVSDESGASNEESNALRELSESDKKLSENAGELIKNFKRTEEDSEQVFKAFEDFAKGVDKVEKNNSNLKSSIENFGEQIHKIMKHMDDISEISERTNLLSFNASIEAAHAGSAGVGFRIIANEVKKLSENTKKASDEIAKTVIALQSKLEILSEQSRQNSELLTSLVASTGQSKDTVYKMGTEAKSNSSFAQNMIELIDYNHQTISTVLQSVKKQNIKQLKEFADSASQNLILFNDIISFSIQIDQIFKYLEENLEN
ncbi:methyl-accepting chemotaxis protein [Treponema sp.]|uniref:methyl-accepting chemotaxis protein n=1 Tax=Treponema sp. TaxID=166 RepID=UPI003EFBEDCC